MSRAFDARSSSIMADCCAMRLRREASSVSESAMMNGSVCKRGVCAQRYLDKYSISID